MVHRRSRGGDTLARALAIAGAVLLMVSGLLVVAQVLGSREEAASRAPAPLPGPPDAPIPEEAHVFQMRPDDLRAGPGAERRQDALPRTLEIYRTLRAYPGAPPRIPHGLTDEEHRNTLCNSCHARGGYVPRFGGYAPVTPHPEYAACLQCHVANAMTLGIGFPDPRPDAICTQCHVDPDRPPPTFVSLDWPDPTWPELNQRALEGSPPLIPHDLQLRGNCLACHAGPGAVREVRTTHPERADCRGCHIPAATSREDAFSRPLDGSSGGLDGDL